MPDVYSNPSFASVTLIARLNVDDELELATSPLAPPLDTFDIDAETRVMITDFTGWTINASHLEGGATMPWSRDEGAGAAWHDFEDTGAFVDFDVTITASGANQARKEKIVQIKVKPKGVPNMLGGFEAPMPEPPGARPIPAPARRPSLPTRRR